LIYLTNLWKDGEYADAVVCRPIANDLFDLKIYLTWVNKDFTTVEDLLDEFEKLGRFFVVDFDLE
jgi:hypothetical protein